MKLSKKKEDERMRTITEAIAIRACLPVETEGTVEKVIQTLLEENIISPSIPGRKLPFSAFESKVATNEVIRFSLEHPMGLSEVISSLCEERGLRLTDEGDTILLTV